jgi:hypothetical protein
LTIDGATHAYENHRHQDSIYLGLLVAVKEQQGEDA